MKKRFSDEQIISMLKEQEAGDRTADVCRRHGISQATFYKYKAKYGGMEPSDAVQGNSLHLKSTIAATAASSLSAHQCFNLQNAAPCTNGRFGGPHCSIPRWRGMAAKGRSLPSQ
jgi:putative transposase